MRISVNIASGDVAVKRQLRTNKMAGVLHKSEKREIDLKLQVSFMGPITASIGKFYIIDCVSGQGVA